MKAQAVQANFFRWGVCISLLFLAASLQPVQAQFGKKLKEKLEKAIQKIEEKQKKKSGSFPSSDVSQSVTAATYESKEYPYWDSNGSYTGGDPDENVKIEILKNDEGKVTKVIVDGKATYLPDEGEKSDFVRNFYNNTNYWRLFFAKKRIFFFKITQPNTDREQYHWEGVAGKAAPYEHFRQVINYMKESRKNQLADLVQYEKDKAAKKTADSLARRKKYDLADKQVASIKITNFKKNKHLGNWDGSIDFSVEATLKNGTKISTANGGYKDNYIIDYINMPGKEYNSKHYSKNHYSNAFQTGFVKGDKVIVSVKLRKNPALKDREEAVMTYTHRQGRVTFNWSATRYGYNGDNLRLEIKKVKHQVTGADLYQYRVTNISKNQIIAVGKVRTDQTMYLGSNGQPGTPVGHSNGYENRGGDGGNGGTITIIKDPNVGSLSGFLQTSVQAGGAGKGYSVLSDGRPGRDGKVVFVTRAVSF